MSEERTEAAIQDFGFNPTDIGLRHRSWWVLEELDYDDEMAGAEIGWLCVRARDGASNPVDWGAARYPNFANATEDGFDCTYRHYYFKPLQTQDQSDKGGMR